MSDLPPSVNISAQNNTFISLKMPRNRTKTRSDFTAAELGSICAPTPYIAPSPPVLATIYVVKLQVCASLVDK